MHHLTGDIKGDLFDSCPESFREKFLDDLEKLMVEYRVQKIDVSWNHNFEQVSPSNKG